MTTWSAPIFSTQAWVSGRDAVDAETYERIRADVLAGLRAAEIGDQLFGWGVLIGPGRLVGVGVEGELHPVGIVTPLTLVAVGELGEREIVARRVVDVDRELDAVLLVQHFLRLDRLVEDGARAQQVGPLLGLGALQRALAQAVHATEDPLARERVRGQRGLLVDLVHHRQVVDQVFLMTVHPGQSIVNDHGHLVSERRVVRLDLGRGHGQDMTVPVLMLQTFSGQGGSARGRTDQKAPGPAVAV